MATDTKYFVAVEVTWGKDVDGVQTVESIGGQNWGSLSYDQAAVVQALVVVPGVVSMLEEAAALGLETAELKGMNIPDIAKDKVTQNKNSVR